MQQDDAGGYDLLVPNGVRLLGPQQGAGAGVGAGAGAGVGAAVGAAP